MVAPMKSSAAQARRDVRDGARGPRAWFTARSVAKAVGGEVVQGGATAQRVTTDTRQDCAGQVFVALRGERYDSHDYLHDAVAKGAVGLVVDRDVDVTGLVRRASLARKREPFVVRVADTSRALLDLAKEHRRRSRAKVVGITGSCGKTSTKEWLGAVVEASMPAVRSPGSYNNDVGVPLTLFQLDDETRAAVVEIGTNAPGEIERLTDVARPDIGIVTCVAPAHLEGLGSLEGVAREKSSLPRGLPSDGVCILNGDDEACRRMESVTSAKVEFVRVNREADWFATDVRFCALGTSFLLHGKRPVTVPRLGSHNVYNALAVIAAAHHLGVPEDEVLHRLADVPSASRRLEPKRAGGVTIFDDTYNMNPASARSALQAMAGLHLERSGRGFAVLGGMAELGADSDKLHRELGEHVARSGQDRLVCVGADAQAIADGARAGGMPAARVLHVDDLDGAHEALLAELAPGDRVLCKASRRVQLDRLVDRLVGDLGARGASEQQRQEAARG